MKGKSLPLGWLCALLMALSFSGATAQIAPELREEGVLYFEGNLPNKVTATLHNSITVYTHRDFQSALATLYNGQPIELLGLADNGYLMKTTYGGNTVTGWIHLEDLPTGVDTSLFAQAKKNQEHHDAVVVAMTNKNVIQGMTPDEVKQSVGRPEQVTSHIDAAASTITWVYTTYREDPQYSYVMDAFGRPVLQTYYVKVPIGQLVVDFTNGLVTSITQHKTDPNSPGVVSN